MNEVPMHSQDHANSEYVSCVGEDRGSAEFIGNKCTNEFPHSLTRTQTLNCTVHITIDKSYTEVHKKDKVQNAKKPYNLSFCKVI